MAIVSSVAQFVCVKKNCVLCKDCGINRRAQIQHSEVCSSVLCWVNGRPAKKEYLRGFCSVAFRKITEFFVDLVEFSITTFYFMYLTVIYSNGHILLYLIICSKILFAKFESKCHAVLSGFHNVLILELNKGIPLAHLARVTSKSGTPKVCSEKYCICSLGFICKWCCSYCTIKHTKAIILYHLGKKMVNWKNYEITSST